MDPNANVRERIALRAQLHMSAADLDRYVELQRAYREWRQRGGFSADADLLAELDRVVDPRGPLQALRE